MTLASLIREDRGTTLVELLVATMAGVLVMFAIVSLVIISLRETDRVTSHVDATQRGRTTLNKVIEELHSACFAPRIAPVLEKSTGTELIFLHQIGSAVALTPTKSYVKLVGSTLSQENLPTTGGTAPNWTYGTASTEQLMTNITPTAPSTAIFNYYSYTNGEVAPTPLPTPLSSENAARVVQVGVAFTAAPLNTPLTDPNAGATLMNSALLRFTPAPYNTAATNLPCE